jgi:hypothetical protein
MYFPHQIKKSGALRQSAQKPLSLFFARVKFGLSNVPYIQQGTEGERG